MPGGATVARRRPPPAQLVGEAPAELETPAADALVGDDHAPFGTAFIRRLRGHGNEENLPAGVSVRTLDVKPDEALKITRKSVALLVRLSYEGANK